MDRANASYRAELESFMVQAATSARGPWLNPTAAPKRILALLDSRALSGARIVEALAALFAAPETLREMSDRASKLARPDAADRVVAECAALLDAEGRR